MTQLTRRLPLLHRPVGMALLTLACSAASANTLSLQGSFTRDDELFTLNFALPAADTVSVSTFAFGGGSSAAGPVAAGGFAPVLSLFLDGFGLVQLARGSSNPCGPGSGAPDPVSGFCWDASFSAALPAGSYTLVLSQDGNEPLGPLWADGFSQTGQPDYTGLAYLGQPGLRFVQVDGSQRSGRWAMDVQASAVPEPRSALMLLAGGALIVVRRMRQQTRETRQGDDS